MTLPLKIKIRSGYGIAFLLLLISYALILYVIHQSNRETSWLTHSYAVINNLYSLKGEIVDAETGVRGYVITKDERFLGPYRSGSKNANEILHEIISLTADNAGYKTRLDSLDKLIARKLNTLANALEQFRVNGFVITPGMSANREANKRVMDSIRLVIAQLVEAEQNLRLSRAKKLQNIFETTKIITVISLLIALLTIGYSLFVYDREKKLKEVADRSAKLYSRDLEESITRLQNMNLELQQLRSMEKFASSGRIARTIAHEVRNPLTNISLASEQLKDLTGQSEDAEVLLDMIGRNAARIGQLVSELLASTRFAQLNYEKTDIRAVLDEALSLAADRIELHNIRIEKSYAECYPLHVDKEKIKLAFLNIIVNAVEAMENGKGKLEIKVRNEQGKCVVEFKDNGIGMDDETVQRLFEPYFTSKPKGTGLGLTYTQNIILNHGGTLNVLSKPGEGALFTVVLNIEKEKAG